MSEIGLLGKRSPTPNVLGKMGQSMRDENSPDILHSPNVVGIKAKSGEILFPADHIPGIKVPKGGSSCASCEYLKDAKKRLCGNTYFIAWNKSEVIPEPIDEYCSDWFDWKGSEK